MHQPILDPVFGILSWDERYLAWVGRVDWSPSLQPEVLVALDRDGSGDLAAIHDSWNWVRANEPTIRRQVIDEVLHECNEEYRPESPATREELMASIELHQIRLEDNKSLRILYNDGYLFGGHVIWADVGADKSYQGVSGID